MPKPEDPINSLFQLRLTDFTAARNALAAQLKKRGLANDAAHVKKLDKPPVSAWTVNQLYWRHREEFDELLATGQRFRKAQASGKIANMREALEARREALSQLSDLATEILNDAGHNPSLDTLRRITTTLEALSSYETLSGEVTAGRLTNDVDPPGFDSFGSFVPSAAPAKTRKEPAPPPSKKPTPVPKPPHQAAAETLRREERTARINAAKASLHSAKKALAAASAAVKSLQAAQRRAQATAAEAERQKRQAEERFKKASAAFADAKHRAENLGAELSEATETLDEATRNVGKATKELEKAFRE